MPMAAYIPLCLFVPAAWGVAMYKAFDWLARRRAASQEAEDGDDQPPIDYSI